MLRKPVLSGQSKQQSWVVEQVSLFSSVAMAASACSLFLVFLVIQVSAIFCSLSGLYVDNGIDQTVIQRVMSSKEKHYVEQELLGLLGLADRPRRNRAVPLNKSAPSFLLDVYRRLDEENGSRMTRSSSDLSLTGEDLQAIDQSDVIMTFQSKNHHGISVRHDRGRRLWFDLSEVPLGEQIFGAELRVYLTPNYTAENPEDVYTISAHKITSIDDKGSLEMDLVSSINTTASKEGWLEINITSAFMAWLDNPGDNNGIYMAVHLQSKPTHEVKPDEIGLVSAKGEDDKQPFMVAFLKASSTLNVKEHTRRKREARKHKKNNYDVSESFARNPFIDPSTHYSSRSCAIQTLYVSFKDLEWQDWIIAPEGYGAFYCSGECNFPLNAHMNATNHAIVQTLVHLLNPSQVPKPCCAPTKLTPISVLYFLDESNVILKKYKNMVVKSCGCH